MDELIEQMIKAGHARKAAISAIRKASRLSAVDGAKALQKMGANYAQAFRVLSQPHVDAKFDQERNSRGTSPVVLVVIGIALCAGGYFATRADYHQAVASNTDHFRVYKGLFFGGIGCFVAALYKWVTS